MTADAPAPAAAGSAWFTAPGGGRLQLWPQKAAFEPDLNLLLVADAHIGKAVSFRRRGVPVPRGSTVEALARARGLPVPWAGLPRTAPQIGRAHV